MPIYAYKCKAGHSTDKIRKFDNRHVPVVCTCGLPAVLLVSAPAKTAWQWGDTNWDGFKDRALGVTYRDAAHRQSIMRQRGLREVQDGEVEREVARATAEHDDHEAQVSKFQRVIAETGSTARAMIETFPTPDA